MSAKPSYVSRTTSAPARSSNAFVATVVPCASNKGVPPPSAFIVASIDCVSNAALFQPSAASASPGRSQPAAVTSATSVKPPPVRNTCLRCLFMC